MDNARTTGTQLGELERRSAKHPGATWPDLVCLRSALDSPLMFPLNSFFTMTLNRLNGDQFRAQQSVSDKLDTQFRQLQAIRQSNYLHAAI
jgi:hypothetical protein